MGLDKNSCPCRRKERPIAFLLLINLGVLNEVQIGNMRNLKKTLQIVNYATAVL
jgi:hypothetical protein